MADSKPGSKTYATALAYRSRGPYKPHLRLMASGSWLCQGRGGVTDGVGVTPQDAFVDFVEELWCMWGDFPAGYPN